MPETDYGECNGCAKLADAPNIFCIKFDRSTCPCLNCVVKVMCKKYCSDWDTWWNKGYIKKYNYNY